MEFWQSIAFTEPDQLVDFARLAEKIGFDGGTTGDHFITPDKIRSPYPYTKDQVPWVRAEDSTPDPLILTAALAQVTQTLRFMVTVFILPMREPISATKSIASAAVLSNNRLVLGVGVGWMREEFEATGHEFERRGRRCDEQLEMMQKLLRGGMVEHSGEFYSFPRVQMCPVPTEPVPVLIGGHSGPAFRRAAQHGGWLAAHYDMKEIPPLVRRFHEALDEAGKTEEPHQIVVPLNDLAIVDQIFELDELGVTAVVNMPLTYRGHPASSLDQKRDSMEQFAEHYMAPFRRDTSRQGTSRTRTSRQA